MFQNFFFRYFLRGLTKSTNNKNLYINNSMLYNKNLNKTNLITNNLLLKKKGLNFMKAIQDEVV